MHDIKLIRDNPDLFDKGMARRGLPAQATALVELDAAYRATQTQMQQVQAKRNELSAQVGLIKRQGGDGADLMAQVSALKDQLGALEEQEKQQAQVLEDKLAALPNILASDVPDGKDEHDNKELRRFGQPPRLENPREHFELGEKLGQMDFEHASRMSGARFTILTDQLALLERALGNFMLDVHTRDFGYREVSPPLMVRDAAMFGTAQLPKFAEDLFCTTTGMWLIPTAEVPLTNLRMDEIVPEKDLPLRVTARTPCFRSEAGSAGKDTRGMLRQHQFYKVELVSIVTPDKSEEEHECMVSCAESILQRLGLAYRVISLCTGDIGFAAQKTYDIEVWLPGQNTYREISSCSNDGDFQARRMNTRFRTEAEKKPRFVHTLNGSGVAIGRCLIAIMENFQNPDGSIQVPQVLRPYMHGLEVIGA